MKLIGGTCVYNEEKMVPYVMPYVERMGYDKFIVYDDGCTDKTIELLSKYDFVEIRSTKDNEDIRQTEEHGGDSCNGRKLDAMIAGYRDSIRAVIGTGEEAWFTFTDFDEVIFCQRERSYTLKSYLEILSPKGYNFLETRMLHLTNGGVKLADGLLPHEIPGTRGTWWLTEGRKVVMIKSLDFERVNFFCGNHSMGVTPIATRPLMNLEDCGEFNTFHFKYYDEDILLSRDKDKLFLENEKQAIQTVKSSSFPMQEYFLLKGFFAKKTPPNKKDNGEGLFTF